VLCMWNNFRLLIFWNFLFEKLYDNWFWKIHKIIFKQIYSEINHFLTCITKGCNAIFLTSFLWIYEIKQHLSLRKLYLIDWIWRLIKGWCVGHFVLGVCHWYNMHYLCIETFEKTYSSTKYNKNFIQTKKYI